MNITDEFSIHLGRIGDCDDSERGDIFSKLYEDSIHSEKLRGPHGLQTHQYLNRLMNKERPDEPKKKSEGRNNLRKAISSMVKGGERNINKMRTMDTPTRSDRMNYSNLQGVNKKEKTTMIVTGMKQYNFDL